MAKDHNIDDLFKGAFEHLEAKPKADIWDKIAGQTAFDAQIKHSFSAFEAIPNTNIWEKIDQQQSFDQQVRASLNSFEAQPKPEVWAAVASHPLEAQMRSTLKDFELEPAASNWEEIRRRIPFTLVFLRNNLPQLSRIAAVLVVGMLLSLSLSDINWIKNSNNGIADNAPAVKNDQPCSLENKAPIVTDDQIASNKEVTEEVKPSIGPLSSPIVSSAMVSATNDAVLNETLVAENEGKTVFSKRIPTTPSNNNTIENYSAVNDSGLANLTGSNAPRIVFTTQEIAGKGSFIPINGIGMTLKKKSVKAQHQQTSSSFNKVTNAFGSNDIDEVSDNFEDIIRNNKLVSRTDNSNTIQTLNYRGLYVIGAAQYGFNWMHNEALRDQLSEIVKTDYVIDFGGSAGVGLGFMLSPRVGLEAQWNYTRINQSYREHVPDGLFLDTETKLTYSSFPVVMKFQLVRLRNNRRVPMTSSLALGGQYRYLRKANVQANVEVDRDLFIEKELGAVIGYDVNFHLSENVFISMGGRASVGTDVDKLSNLSKGGRFNTEIGLRMAVNYKLKR